jgi:hypothetical protein
MESMELLSKVTLAREGPNQILFPLAVNYFIHNLDSIFIDTQFNTYYLINDRAEVMKVIGRPSNNFSMNDLSISFESGSFFYGDEIYGNIRMPFYGTPQETIYARASIKLEEQLDITFSVKTNDFINNYNEVLAYRKEEENGIDKLINLPRYFVNYGDNLYATTPVSDSIYIFRDGFLIDKFYGGIPGIDKATHIEYLHFTRTVRRPGEVIYEHETKRNAYYLNTLMDPDGRFIYRVMILGTHPVFNENGDKRIPEFNGATLLAIDLNTKEISTFELPLDEIIVERQLFASREGVHFMFKHQENEDQVLFRIFGMNEQ